MNFDSLEFNKIDVENSLSEKAWPFVYLLYDENLKECYVGETIDIKKRMNQHLQKKEFKKILTITDEEFNKSFTLDIEANLIELFMCDNNFLLKNIQGGIKHEFFEKDKTDSFISIIWSKLKKMGIVENELNLLKKNLFYQLNPLKPLTSTQENIIHKIIENIKDKNYKNYTIRGQAGTGKTLCANALFYLLCTKEFSTLKIAYTSGNTQLREDLKPVFKKYSRYFSNKNIVSPIDIVNEYIATGQKFDYVIIDEAQRLKRREALTNYRVFDETSKKLELDEKKCSEFDWIEKVSNNQIILFDEFQSIKNSDLNILETLKNIEHNEFLISKELRMTDGDEYLKLVKNILFSDNNNLATEKIKKYDFKIYDSFKEMYTKINELNEIYGKCFLLSGLGFKKINFKGTKNWNSSKKRVIENSDFEIDGIGLNWNISTKNWIESEMSRDDNNMINEVGCVHVMQGQTLNYAAVIISEEIDYVDGKIIINKELYNDSKMLQNYDEDRFKELLLKSYYVLLTRAVKGTYVYIANMGLREYIKSELTKYNLFF